jgi:hypothetical protein
MKTLARIIAITLCFSQHSVPHAAEVNTGSIGFYVDMSADQQPAIVDSTAKASVDLVLDKQTLRLNWTIAFSDLTSAPIALHIRNQKPGSRGPLIYDLTPKPPESFKSPMSGSVIMTERELHLLLDRYLYVDLHTEKYPDGEVRGQIERGKRQAPRKQ